MFEKVNPSHPDKIADRIAGAIVDYAYQIKEDPKIAVEVLIGHNECNIIIESDIKKELDAEYIEKIVYRICNNDSIIVDIHKVNQDPYLAENQSESIRCGDNGIFKGIPVTDEQRNLTRLVSELYNYNSSDGKYIINNEDKVIIACQSCISTEKLVNDIASIIGNDYKIIANPIGEWEGGIDVDSGATNRKLGSDMGDSITGGGLHGKDLSKADVAINIYCFLRAQILGKDFSQYCAIGDDEIDGKPYEEIVNIAKTYINSIGGFEKFAEWGLIR